MKEDNQPSGPESLDRLLEEAILAYLDAKKSGSVDKDGLKARYALVAAELAEFIAAEEVVGAALSPPSILKPAADGAPAGAGLKAFGKYADIVFLSRGGMGVVYRCRDTELGRPIALKVMHAHLAQNPDYVRDFHEEARVASQLTHPNIAPVHELGALPEPAGRPYFTMKLVEGRTTLAQVIRDYHAKPTPEGFDALLRHFMGVCHALAYAHQRRVLHRDLKPANVMVGEHGEVQVMDWGLSKVVARADAGDVATVRPDQPGPVWTGGSETPTEPGLVRGTFAYMPPEQAVPGTSELDARCDVFALGALLCEIFTNAPPYTSAEKDPERRGRELYEAARTCATNPAFERLKASGAPAELKALTKRCLARETKERPASATAVAKGVTKYLAGAQEKLRKAEIARARLRWQLALAATVLAAVAGVGAGALWYQHDQYLRTIEHNRRVTDMEHEVTTALKEATALGQQAATLKDDPEKWGAALTVALSAVKRAEGVLNSGEGGEDLRARVGAMRAELEAADKDRRMIARIEEARLRKDGFDKARAAAEYDAAFEEDMGLKALDAGSAAERIAQRPIREELLAALADWAAITPNKEDARKLRGVLLAADPDALSFRNRWNAALDSNDWEGVRRLASEPEAQNQPPARLATLGFGLIEAGGAAEAAAFLQEANQRRAHDFWISLELGIAFTETNPPDLNKAIWFYMAARALRPNSALVYNNKGIALARLGQLDDAAADLHMAVGLRPDIAEFHVNLGVVDRRKGLPKEALAEFREAVRLQPDHVNAHTNLGQALLAGLQAGEAITEFREVVRLTPEDPMAHRNLGYTLLAAGQWEEGWAEINKADEPKQVQIQGVVRP